MSAFFCRFVLTHTLVCCLLSTCLSHGWPCCWLSHGLLLLTSPLAPLWSLWCHFKAPLCVYLCVDEPDDEGHEVCPGQSFQGAGETTMTLFLNVSSMSLQFLLLRVSDHTNTLVARIRHCNATHQHIVCMQCTATFFEEWYKCARLAKAPQN